MHRDRFYTLSASCPDQVGIIARVSGFIAGNGGWILESSFHADAVTGRYFMRIEIKADSLPFLLAEFRERFRQEVGEPLHRPVFRTSRCFGRCLASRWSTLRCSGASCAARGGCGGLRRSSGS